MPAQYLGLKDYWGELWELWLISENKYVAVLMRKPDREVAAHTVDDLMASALDLQTELDCGQD